MRAKLTQPGSRLSCLLPFLVGAILLVAACDSDEEGTPPTATPSPMAPSVTLTHAASIPTATSLLPATPMEPPAATPEAPTAMAVPGRFDCDEIRGTPYRSGSERIWYLDNCVTPAATQPAGAPTTGPATQGPVPQANVRYLFRVVNGVMVPDLAEAWEFRDGNSVIAFKLAPAVILADGRPFDSTAAKQILDARRAQLTASGYIDTSVLDPRTIFVMLQPAALDSVLQALATIEFPIQSP
jgi:hypothetical protein